MILADLFTLPHLIPNVVALIHKEWPDPIRTPAAVEQRLCGDRDPAKFPTAIVALDGDSLIGFVSLTLWEAGVEKGRPHWIDALFVDPAHRGQGISRLLILAAEKKARTLGVTRLLALTELPRVYGKVGWTALDRPTPASPRDFVMQKAL